MHFDWRDEDVVDLTESRRKILIREAEYQQELDRVSRIVRLTGHTYPSRIRHGIWIRERMVRCD